jgi:long-chain acyl-CoA synthetase
MSHWFLTIEWGCPVSATKTDEMVLSRVYRWEKERGSKVYMIQPMGGGRVKKFTWGETMKEVRSMAAHLKSHGFPEGSKIAILSKNCAHFMMSDLAIWMAGYVSVALYPTLTEDSISYILEHSESKLVFVGKLDTWDAQKSAIPEGMPCISYPLSPKTDYPTWDTIVKETDPMEESPTRDPEETAMLMYTSGSTGTPKGVEHTYRSIIAMADVVSGIMKVTPEDRLISYLPLAHAFERCAVEMLSYVVPVQVFFAESLETFVQDLNRAKPTIFHSVPRLWLKFQLGVLKKMPPKKLNFLLKIPILSGIVKKKVLTGLGLDQTRIAITGSAPVPPELIKWYRDLGLELLEGYAMTEDFIYSHLSLPGKSRIGYVGNLVEGAKSRISEEGEILLKSPGNMKGYYKEPELTAESYTEDGYFKTGDRGEYDNQGRLKITGRVKELFKSQKGKYIAPAPIENIINASNDVELSCVTGSGLKAPLAIIQLSEAHREEMKKSSFDKAAVEASLNALVSKVNSEVEEWEKIACIVVAKEEWAIENEFLTPTMKIKRAKIDDTYGDKLEGWVNSGSKVIWE